MIILILLVAIVLIGVLKLGKDVDDHDRIMHDFDNEKY